jgi:predicted nucleic acid-binding protein
MRAKIIVADVLPVCISMLAGLAVPEAVLQECIADSYAPGAAVIEHLHRENRFEVIPHTEIVPLDTALAQGLGTGEIAVLSYATQHQLLALIDERRARRVAQRLNISVIGSGSLLATLQRQGFIDSVEPAFAAWQKHGYFVSEKVKDDIRRSCGA